MRIYFLDDVLRDEGLPARDFFYEIVEEAVLYSFDADFLYPARKWRSREQTHNICPSTLHRLIGSNDTGNTKDAQNQWARYYQSMPSAVNSFVLSELRECDLVIGYEMAPWLTDLMQAEGFPCVNIRLSPYRFGRDLYVAMSSPHDLARERISAFMMRDNEVRLDAGHLGASARHSRRFSKTNLSMNDTVIFIGQTECDASLINDKNEFASIADYESEIADYCGGKRVLYKGHPYAGKHAACQRRHLETLMGHDVRDCPVDVYEILSADDTLSLIGLSSGVLQEARFFNKPARQLLPPICQITFDPDAFCSGNYIQVESGIFLAPEFWKHLLTPGKAALQTERKMTPVQNNYLRELHNAWWGYSGHFAKSQLFREAIQWNASLRANVGSDKTPLY